MKYLLFTIALALSTVAEWYAIVGLMAIFASAPVPIAIMGALLGAAKLVIASWLYRNWKEIPMLMKTYFTISLLILMFLTSMGIFGFLSKAHLDQAVPSGDIVAKLNIVDDKIKTAKENIDANRKALKQMDEAVDQVMARSNSETGADKSVAIRRGQQKERARLQTEIASEQKIIGQLSEERAPIASEVRKVEAEVGPIKYIAAVIYGDQLGDDILEKAVRAVTMLIVAVFDPLAVLLLIAANWQMNKEKTITQHPLQSFFDRNKEKFSEPRPITDFPDLQEAVKTGLEDGTLELKGADNTEEPLNIVVEETKDWDPKLYQRTEPRTYWTPKTQSFIAKVRDTIQPKSIETEVEDLQKDK
jgi:hypothetical protein